MHTDNLSSFPFLSELTPSGRAELLAATSKVVLPPRTQVIRRGDEVAGVYLVDAGALRVYYVSAEGREGTLYWIDAGQSCVLALNCLFARMAYPAWVETDQSETRVAVVSGDVYRRLYLTEPALQKFTFATLSTRLFDLMTLMQETASLGLEQRVAAFLLRRSENGELEASHEDIAHHLGSSREVISRVLRNLASQGAIHLSRRSIAIADSAMQDLLEALDHPAVIPGNHFAVLFDAGRGSERLAQLGDLHLEQIGLDVEVGDYTIGELWLAGDLGDGRFAQPRLADRPAGGAGARRIIEGWQGSCRYQENAGSERCSHPPSSLLHVRCSICTSWNGASVSGRRADDRGQKSHSEDVRWSGRRMWRRYSPLRATSSKAAASSCAPGSSASCSILASVAAMSLATVLLRIATGLRS